MKNIDSKVKIKVALICIACIIIALVVCKITIKNNDNGTSEHKVIGDIKTVQEFYGALESDMLPLTDLPSDYSIYDAIDDGCFRLFAKIYNEQAYDEFMNAYNKKEKAFIRIVETTDEGDIILFDVAYIPDNDRIYVVTDTTRDEFSSEEDKAITLKEFENIGIYHMGSNSYLVAYTGELTEQNEENMLILTMVL